MSAGLTPWPTATPAPAGTAAAPAAGAAAGGAATAGAAATGATVAAAGWTAAAAEDCAARSAGVRTRPVDAAAEVELVEETGVAHAALWRRTGLPWPRFLVFVGTRRPASTSERLTFSMSVTLRLKKAVHDTLAYAPRSTRLCSDTNVPKLNWLKNTLACSSVRMLAALIKPSCCS